MITQPLRCSHCQSENLIKNGHAKNGKQCFRCKDCNKCGRENPGSNAYSQEAKAIILAAYQERASIRGLRRVFGVSRNTVAKWLKKSQSVASPGNDPAASTRG